MLPNVVNTRGDRRRDDRRDRLLVYSLQANSDKPANNVLLYSNLPV